MCIHIGMVGGEKDDIKHALVKDFAALVLSCWVPPILVAASIWAVFSKDMVVVMIKTVNWVDWGIGGVIHVKID